MVDGFYIGVEMQECKACQFTLACFGGNIRKYLCPCCGTLSWPLYYAYPFYCKKYPLTDHIRNVFNYRFKEHFGFVHAKFMTPWRKRKTNRRGYITSIYDLDVTYCLECMGPIPNPYGGGVI